MEHLLKGTSLDRQSRIITITTTIYLIVFSSTVIRTFNGDNKLPELTVKGNKRRFSPSKFTFMNVKFGHQYGEVKNKCLV